MLLSEAFERHRQDRIVFGNQSHKTEEQYIYTCKSLLKFIGKNLDLQELSFETIRKWKESMEKRGLGSRTVRGYIISLRVVLGYMQKLGEKCLDPESILTPKRIDRIPSVITAEDVNKLIELVNKTPKCSKLIKARNTLIISMLYGSGLRISELCGLNREDLTGDTFTVVGKGKSGFCQIDARTRILLDQYLKLRKDANPALFIDNILNSRLTANSVQHLFRRLTEAGNFSKPIHPHTLRHSYATNLLKNGCHIYTLSRLMRHSSIATTEIYLHLHDQDLVEAYGKYHTT